MHNLISPKQSGFTSESYIGNNTRFYCDLMYCSLSVAFTGPLILADFQKANDSISCKFLYSVMKIQWIWAWYSKMD